MTVTSWTCIPWLVRTQAVLSTNTLPSREECVLCETFIFADETASLRAALSVFKCPVIVESLSQKGGIAVDTLLW